MEDSNEVIELTRKDVYTLFADVDKSSSQFKTNKMKDYIIKLNSKLPSSYVLTSDHHQIIKDLLRKYRQKKNEKLPCAEIINMAGNDVVLSIFVPHSFSGDESNVLLGNLIDPVLAEHQQEPLVVEPPPPPPDERPPKKPRGSDQFTISFTDSYKDFVNMSDRQRKNVTDSLITVLQKFIENNQHTLSLNRLLGYLLIRVNDAGSVLS